MAEQARGGRRYQHGQSGFEALERRQMLTAVTAGVSAGGTLWVQGTGAGETIVISRDPINAALYHVSAGGHEFVLSSKAKRIRVDAGGGNDTVVIDSAHGKVYLQATLLGGAGNDVICAGVMADSVDGGAGNDTLSARAGNDTVMGLDGDDLIDCGDGNDSCDGGNGNDSIYGQAGSDTIRGQHGNDWVYGNDGNDYVGGCFEDDHVYGGDGNDFLDGLTGSDWLEGGNGDDVISGNTGKVGPDLLGDTDSIYGGAGNDDFDPSDTAAEIKDQVAGDAGRNATVPNIVGWQTVLAGRSFA